jgi:dynamin 1-like protein
LVGNDFLPRGTGIVTRCPLVLQLIHISKEEAGDGWGWATFLHDKEKRYNDFSKVREEIRAETDRKAGMNKGISSDPIRLRVYSSHVLDLTLVDLPGITKVPVGDQPDDIEQQTHDLCRTYITNPNSIILAVSPANADIATSESIKLAKSVDPQGNRTLAVCTKLDLMDRGTDAHDILEGKVIPVKLGIIGVVNRSQEDIDKGKAIEDAIHDEASFLKRRYPLLATKNGTPYLARRLNKLLMFHIRQCLPDLRARIASMINKHETVLSHLGQPIGNKGSTLLQILTQFASEYNSTIEGTAKDIETDRLSGGARICYIFHNIFKETVHATGPLTGLSQSDIIHAITNATGPRPSLFVPEMAFELLVKKQIRLLLPPSLHCVEKVYEEMQRIMQYTAQHMKEFQRFPLLKDEIVKVVSGLLKERLPLANSMVEDLISIELAYINTNHPDFIGGKNAAYESVLLVKQQTLREEVARSEKLKAEKESVPEDLPVKKEAVENAQPRWFSLWSAKTKDSMNRPDSTPVDKEDEKDAEKEDESDNSDMEKRIDCQLIESLITSYFTIVRKTIQDCVPKAVMHCLVNQVKDSLQSKLVSELYKSDVVDHVMVESPEIYTRRKETAAMLEALHKAMDILAEIRDMGAEEFF